MYLFNTLNRKCNFFLKSPHHCWQDSLFWLVSLDKYARKFIKVQKCRWVTGIIRISGQGYSCEEPNLSIDAPNSATTCRKFPKADLFIKFSMSLQHLFRSKKIVLFCFLSFSFQIFCILHIKIFNIAS